MLANGQRIFARKIKKLNSEYNVDMFSMNVRGGKILAAE